MTEAPRKVHRSSATPLLIAAAGFLAFAMWLEGSVAAIHGVGVAGLASHTTPPASVPALVLVAVVLALWPVAPQAWSDLRRGRLSLGSVAILIVVTLVAMGRLFAAGTSAVLFAGGMLVWNRLAGVRRQRKGESGRRD